MIYSDCSGFKYCVEELTIIQTPFQPVRSIVAADDKLTLYPDGELWVHIGFLYDGPSGPTYDSKNTLVPSLMHDIFQLFSRMGLLEGWLTRAEYDEYFRVMLKAYGMNRFRAWAWYRGVRIGGWRSARIQKSQRLIKLHVPEVDMSAICKDLY